MFRIRIKSQLDNYNKSLYLVFTEAPFPITTIMRDYSANSNDVRQTSLRSFPDAIWTYCYFEVVSEYSSHNDSTLNRLLLASAHMDFEADTLNQTARDIGEDRNLRYSKGLWISFKINVFSDIDSIVTLAGDTGVTLPATPTEIITFSLYFPMMEATINDGGVGNFKSLLCNPLLKSVITRDEGQVAIVSNDCWVIVAFKQGSSNRFVGVTTPGSSSQDTSFFQKGYVGYPGYVKITKQNAYDKEWRLQSFIDNVLLPNKVDVEGIEVEENNNDSEYIRW